MRPVGNHIHAAVLRAVVTQAGLSIVDRVKPILVVEAIRSTDWASATFVGATHEIDLRLEGERIAVETVLQHLETRLPDCEIPIAGQIVAEIAVTLREDIACPDNMFTKLLTVNVLTIVD